MEVACCIWVYTSLRDYYFGKYVVEDTGGSPA